MADTKREIERKYESDDAALPDLTRVPGVASVRARGVTHLDATYYDTADQRLAASSVTLRRRTGGADAGWHLKFPVAPGVRDEIRAPLSDTLPEELAALVRSRVRHRELRPVVRLRSDRDVRHLLDDQDRLLAEVSVDTVHAERLTGEGGEARWTEIEVELADDGDPAFLDKVEKRLRKAGVRPSSSSSKLARALTETAPAAGPSARREAAGTPPATAPEAAPRHKHRPRPDGTPVTAGDHVLAYVRAQRDALVELDPAVRQDVPDAVHRMRVATRRLRSTFRSFRAVLDRAATDPVAADLKWLAAELGKDRDQEVLAERLTQALGKLTPDQVTGPVAERLAAWSEARHQGAHHEVVAILDSRRYLSLLDTLDALLADPPLRKKAAARPGKVLAKAVHKDFGKLAGLVEHALELPPGQERDTALHEARKKTKRTRYAAEAAVPALGGRAEEAVRDMKALQGLLGDHQDSVMARRTLRELAAVAHAAGESDFTYGVLYAGEAHRARVAEEALPEAWSSVSREFPL
ncbi:CYTH and CHAD domain-containing protein [Streptomyces cellulosae]|uniref:CYTH and CHAD domain-containing protein n=1 Tax=Streptomyces cellulosae TaxID=1968 RepID=UPI0022543963|nr:CYTH and CHAD domain-containing protein [Streptomyces cellulosae]WTB90808.1 CYTH and CHAD domain-containing protein [Streptomyces cellulosae]WTC58168.1 CYTH and CHAD domain-containing protein [Streptomyces cellulosae]